MTVTVMESPESPPQTVEEPDPPSLVTAYRKADAVLDTPTETIESEELTPEPLLEELEEEEPEPGVESPPRPSPSPTKEMVAEPVPVEEEEEEPMEVLPAETPRPEAEVEATVSEPQGLLEREVEPVEEEAKEEAEEEGKGEEMKGEEMKEEEVKEEEMLEEEVKEEGVKEEEVKDVLPVAIEPEPDEPVRAAEASPSVEMDTASPPAAEVAPEPSPQGKELSEEDPVKPIPSPLPTWPSPREPSPPRPAAAPAPAPGELAGNVPSTTFIPVTPKIGMGKPAISKRKFSPGRPRAKQVGHRFLGLLEEPRPAD